MTDELKNISELTDAPLANEADESEVRVEVLQPNELPDFPLLMQTEY